MMNKPQRYNPDFEPGWLPGQTRDEEVYAVFDAWLGDAPGWSVFYELLEHVRELRKKPAGEVDIQRALWEIEDALMEMRDDKIRDAWENPDEDTPRFDEWEAV